MHQNEIDRDPQSTYANTSEIEPTDRPLLSGVTGREDNNGIDPASTASADADQPIGAMPRIEVTGRHEPGTGANETVDGLSGTEDSVRAAAEGELEVERLEDIPVFDRADAAPKII